MSADYQIERARADDLPQLPEIERRACDLFLSHPRTADLPTYLTSPSDVDAAFRAGLLWVARAPAGEPVGFALAEEVGGELHLEELDVLPEHGRRGVGTALVREVLAMAAASERETVTLCTFADVPWNAPFFEKLGFRRLAGHGLTRALRDRLARDARRGLPANLRVAMRAELCPPILWRRLDRAGHEACRLVRLGTGWQLGGSALFAHDRKACRLNYAVVCDRSWKTTGAHVSGWVGSETVDVEVSVDAGRRWRLNGVEVPCVAGCIDLDLNFSPSTNTLPIRRLGLCVGQEAPLRAAWLRFPGFELEPLEQVYRRLEAGRYRYESGGGAFVADLDVEASGLVTRYPGVWESEASSRIQLPPVPRPSS